MIAEMKFVIRPSLSVLDKKQIGYMVDRALELLAFVLHHPASEQQTRDQIEPLRTELAHRVSAPAVTAAETRGRALDLDKLVATILSPPDTGP